MLTVDDVVQFTNGRLEDDDETERLLAAAYAAARNYCNWHVTPIRTDEVVLHGPFDQLLALPTMQLLDLTDVVEDGVALDVAELLWVPGDGQPLRGIVRKQFSRRWSRWFNSIHVTMEHGFDVAPDFDQAVLEMVDQLSLASVAAGIRESADLVRKKVRDVEYQWSDGAASAASTSMLNTGLLGRYRMLSAP